LAGRIIDAQGDRVAREVAFGAGSLRFAGVPVWFVLSTAPERGSAVTAVPVSAPEKESVFLRVADYVSAAMGRPTNIMIWLIAVIAWTAVFAFGGHHIAGGTWLPAWFTSQGFNFPLNLITTVAELFIGFLVAAASNRSERNLETTLARLSQQDQQIADVDNRLGDTLAQNMTMTSELKDLLAQNVALTKTVEELARQVHAVVCTATPGTA
jgi:low affinity Fe/Cu permease